MTAFSGGLDTPIDLTFGPDGHLYVASGRSSPAVKRYHGTTGAFLGNFVPSGSGGLTGVDIQETTLEGSGRKTFTQGGFGRLLVESVCDSWSVRVLAT